MENSSINTSPKKSGRFKDVCRDLTQLPGRDSPESTSLYSDYESGQQYEQDIPSGYNSGEQYDTVSTGYMSGEAYELPETRTELPEPTLAAIEEVSTRSNEDLFTLTMPDNQLLVQTERLESSSSSSLQVSLEMATVTEGGSLAGNNPGHGRKKNKKTVSYCSSVPLDKSPLGAHEVRIYNELPSDTDTTSAFDSDGTYMREGLSSDSGAALISHSSGRRKRRDYSGESGIIRSAKSSRRGKRSKKIERDYDSFFHAYDSKNWDIARQICFWASILGILTSIGAAVIMIIYMPRTCDPVTNWWQGSVLLEVGPNPATNHSLNLSFWLNNIHNLTVLGIKGLKLVDMYRADGSVTTVMGQTSNSSYTNGSTLNKYYYHDPADMDLIRSRLDGGEQLLKELIENLHAANLTLVVEIPTTAEIQGDTPISPTEIQGDTEATSSEIQGDVAVNTLRLTLEHRFNISKAIQFWSQLGVDGVVLLGLEEYAQDPYLLEAVRMWNSNFEEFGQTSNEKILATSYLLPERLNRLTGAGDSAGEPGVAAGEGDSSSSTESALANFHLLTATLHLEKFFTSSLQEERAGDEAGEDAGDEAGEDAGEDAGDDQLLADSNKDVTQKEPLDRHKRHLADQISAAAHWDKMFSRPWIVWSQGQLPQHDAMSGAQLAFQMLLPGTISLPWDHLPDQQSLAPNQTILADLLAIRQSAVPVYMNGNYKACHQPCNHEKEDNYNLHTFGDGLVVLERHYSRRNRYVLIANFGEAEASLLPVAKMYSDGEILVDTLGLLSKGTMVNIKTLAAIPTNQAYVMKLPK